MSDDTVDIKTPEGAAQFIEKCPVVVGLMIEACIAGIIAGRAMQPIEFKDKALIACIVTRAWEDVAVIALAAAPSATDIVQ